MNDTSESNIINDEEELSRFEHIKFGYYGIQWETYLKNIQQTLPINHNGETPLYPIAIGASCHDTITPISKTTLEQIISMYKDYICHRNKKGSTILHAALQCGCSFFFVQTICQNEVLLDMNMKGGTTPLHIIVSSNYSNYHDNSEKIQIIKYIVEHSSEDVIHKKDCHGNIPIIKMWKYLYWNIPEFIQFLSDWYHQHEHATTAIKHMIQLYWDISLLLLPNKNKIMHSILSLDDCPNGLFYLALYMGYQYQLSLMDYHGQLPLHIACNRNKIMEDRMEEHHYCNYSFRQLSQISNIDPPSIWKLLPYRHDSSASATENKENGPSIVELVFKLHPNSASIPYKNQLPLHIYISCYKHYTKEYYSTLKTLIYSYPQALRMRDVRTKLYPFMLMATTSMEEDDVMVSCIYLLLQSCPEIVNYSNTCNDRDSMKSNVQKRQRFK